MSHVIDDDKRHDDTHTPRCKEVNNIAEADCYNCFNASQSIAGSWPVGLQWNFVPIGTDSLKKPPIFR